MLPPWEYLLDNAKFAIIDPFMGDSIAGDFQFTAPFSQAPRQA